MKYLMQIFFGLFFLVGSAIGEPGKTFFILINKLSSILFSNTSKSPKSIKDTDTKLAQFPFKSKFKERIHKMEIFFYSLTHIAMMKFILQKCQCNYQVIFNRDQLKRRKEKIFN
jgi:hypothetical protein